MLFKHSTDKLESRGLSDISSKELLELCRLMANNSVDGRVYFESDDLYFNETLDGIDCTFGINEDEDITLQVEDYEDRDVAEAILRKNPNILEAMTQLYENYGPVQIECNMFPTFNHEGDANGNVTYGTLPYDRRKFGQQGAFIVKEVNTWSPKAKGYVNAVEKVRRSVFSRLQEADNSKWRVYGEKNTRLNLNMPFVLDELHDLILDEGKYQGAMKVLENPEGDSHRNILERMLNGIKIKLEKSINHRIGRTNSAFGKLNEKSKIKGGVLNVKTPSGLYKFDITNKSFDSLKKAKFMTRENIKELEALADLNFFNDVFGFDAKDDEVIDQAIEKVSNNFRSNKVGEERINHFLSKVIDELKREGYELIEDEVREKAINNVLAAESDLQEIKQQVDKEDMDPDTERKTRAVLDKLEKKLAFVKKHINVKSYVGQAYVIYLLKLVLAPRLGSIETKISESYTELGQVISNAVEPERVLLLKATAQPWTTMHDSMVFEAKQKLQEYGASKVYVLVNGDGYEERIPTATSEGERFSLQKESPLSINRRIGLVSSLYEDDTMVEVCPRGFKEGNSMDMLDDVFMRENKQVVGVVCPHTECEETNSYWADFSESSWQESRCFELPIAFNESASLGVSDLGMTEGKARKLVKEVGLDMWLEMVAPVGISEGAMKKYEEVYNTLYDHFTSIDEEEYRSKMKGMFWSGE